jgi:alkanesulfonate monooxygenase SsuD/methylene tetrahydromethanopterin reductase-like flavin-dependent oxidoreductase (luciferase family)
VTSARDATDGVHPWVDEHRGRVRFGVFGGPRTRPWAEFLDYVRAAEEMGFDAYWSGDHPLWGTDCWATLAGLAVSTRTIRLGSLVSCVDFRSPVELARAAGDVDRWSGGRLVLGIGSGDNVNDEYRRMGVPLLPLRERQARLAEAIQIVRGLWEPTPFTFTGTHYRVADANVPPGPVQRPRVPILVAGGGERVTLRLVAQHADASNFGPSRWTGSAFDADDVRRKCAALRAHCAALGRPYDAILRSCFTGPVVCAETAAAVRAQLDAFPQETRDLMGPSLVGGTPRELIAYYQAFVDAGLQYFVAMSPSIRTMRLLAERVIPELVPAGPPAPAGEEQAPH